jgi:orotidine-5'-phosphate decarboxylase
MEIASQQNQTLAEPQNAVLTAKVQRDPLDSLIVALDLPSSEGAMDMVDRLQGNCRWFKVGLELYCAAGNSIIEHLRERGFFVFLDLKLLDIPNTVAGAVRTVARSGASLLTIHASGGHQMMRAAAQAASPPGAPKLLAVTVLTSMDAAQLSCVGVSDSPATQVQRLARLAKASGIDGLVCSAEEVEAVRSVMGPDALLVVPGIRPATPDEVAAPDDQSRIATPSQAIARGASMLVVGRPITLAPDPAKAAAAVLAEIAKAG